MLFFFLFFVFFFYFGGKFNAYIRATNHMHDFESIHATRYKKAENEYIAPARKKEHKKQRHAPNKGNAKT